MPEWYVFLFAFYLQVVYVGHLGMCLCLVQRGTRTHVIYDLGSERAAG
jgi:hypothetical protein